MRIAKREGSQREKSNRDACVVCRRVSTTSPRSVAIGHYQPVVPRPRPGRGGAGRGPFKCRPYAQPQPSLQTPPLLPKPPPPPPAVSIPSLPPTRHLHRPVSPKDETPRGDLYIKAGRVASGVPETWRAIHSSSTEHHQLSSSTRGGRRSEVLPACFGDYDQAATYARAPESDRVDRQEAGRHPSGMGGAADSAAAAAGRKRGAGAGTRCELCGGAAAVHCAADSAFLCLRCDAKVHGANFLASRHLRRRLPRAPSAEKPGAASSASTTTTSCVSTADSAESAAVAPAPAVLEGWAKRMGFAAGPARRRAAAAAAGLRALGRGVATARVPLRVAMAAALWSEVAAAECRGGSGGEAALLRLEAAAHVPARLVLTVASWMARAASRPAGPAAEAEADGQDHEEGWAECS